MEFNAMAVTKTDSTNANDPANVADATEFNPSGAPVQHSKDVDPSHPAVDANPRAGTTVNQIDFNDPNLSGEEAVIQNLKDQGVKPVEADKSDI
jgi:hypothetical protein